MQSLLDDNGLKDVTSAAEAVKQAVEQQQFQKATELWSVTETVVEQVGATQEDHSKGNAFIVRCRHFFLYRQLFIAYISKY